MNIRKTNDRSKERKGNLNPKYLPSKLDIKDWLIFQERFKVRIVDLSKFQEESFRQIPDQMGKDNLTIIPSYESITNFDPKLASKFICRIWADQKDLFKNESDENHFVSALFGFVKSFCEPEKPSGLRWAITLRSVCWRRAGRLKPMIPSSLLLRVSMSNLIRTSSPNTQGRQRRAPGFAMMCYPLSGGWSSLM